MSRFHSGLCSHPEGVAGGLGAGPRASGLQGEASPRVSAVRSDAPRTSDERGREPGPRRQAPPGCLSPTLGLLFFLCFSGESSSAGRPLRSRPGRLSVRLRPWREAPERPSPWPTGPPRPRGRPPPGDTGCPASALGPPGPRPEHSGLCSGRVTAERPRRAGLHPFLRAGLGDAAAWPGTSASPRAVSPAPGPPGSMARTEPGGGCKPLGRGVARPRVNHET